MDFSPLQISAAVVPLVLICFTFIPQLMPLRSKITSLPATYLVTLFVWLLGMIYCIRTTKVFSGLVTKELFGEFSASLTSVLWIVCVISAGHQLLIFKSLHDLDHKPELRANFLPWFGHPGEWLLRFLAIVCLLSIGGEIPHVLAEYTTDQNSSQPAIHADSAPSGTDAATPSGETKQQAMKTKQQELDRFASCSLCLFLFLLLWDTGCQRMCKYKLFTWPPHAHVWFFAADLMGFITWLTIFLALLYRFTALILPSLFISVGYLAVILCRLHIEIVRPFFATFKTVQAAQP